jgi:hypothetical protein
MAQNTQQDPSRALFAVPTHLSDPEKLQHLASVMGLDPDTLLRTVEEDYAGQLRAHPHIYQAQGPEKGGLLVLILQQCKEMAEGYEQELGGPDHLSRTLQHVQAHLAVLVADYEEQTRQQERRSAIKAGPDA